MAGNWGHESRQARGYGAEWDKLRLQVLRRDFGLCQCDRCQGGKLAVKNATEVDHIVSKAKGKAMGWPDSRIDAMDNLQAINHDCHVRKTQEEQGKSVKVAIGRDGWPVE